MSETGFPEPGRFSGTRSVLRAIKDGDKDAYAELWDLYVGGLKIDLLRRIRSLPMSLQTKLLGDVDDLIQVVMLSGYRGIHKFERRGSGALLGWYTRILENEFINRLNYWKARSRDPGKERTVPDGSESRPADFALAASGTGPLTKLGLSEQYENIGLAMATLSERDYKILHLRFFSGASWQEIAHELGASSPDAVRMECKNRSLPEFARALREVVQRRETSAT